MFLSVFFFCLVGVSFGLTGLLRKYALSNGLLDVPNSRSSHMISTPRGGGGAIVLVFSVGLVVLALVGMLPMLDVLALLAPGLLVAAIGFWDDHGHVPARWRLLGHFIAAFLALFFIGGLPPVRGLGFEVALGWFGYVLAAVYLVWLLNLYNFMDGIDGIASVEAICVCVGGALLYLMLGAPDSGSLLDWVVPMVLAAAVLGFLFWNFPPAKIFMGDAGSGFLGVSLGVLSLKSAWFAPQLLWSWLVLLGVFVVDATWTLFIRMSRGERVYEAHRSHAYQHAARLIGKHRTVTLAVIAINICWLLPIALLIGFEVFDGVFGLVLAYFPLAILAVFFKAGKRES